MGGIVRAVERGDLVHLRRARDQMDREYARPLDVEVLARTACMSSGHFSRSFRAAYGETLSAYRARDHAWMESMPACLMRVALRPVSNREATLMGSR